jgi:hypothetical protein
MKAALLRAVRSMPSPPVKAKTRAAAAHVSFDAHNAGTSELLPIDVSTDISRD